MSSFSLPARYQSYLGANFFQRQWSNVADALPGVIARGLSTPPKAPGVTSPNASLPDMSDVDKPKTPTMLYVGLGLGAAILAAALMGRKKVAPKAA